MTAAIIFLLTYAGVAAGRIPGLALDRVGIAVLGAIAMVVGGVLTPAQALSSIDLPTVLLLYALMIVSAQLRLGGFYTRTATAVTRLLRRPRLFLLALMVSSALLSALLANDIVCFAFTPVLTLGLLAAGLDPVPFLIGLAVSSNIGSAATLIGNPQNMLIGQVGRLDFLAFTRWCLPPAVIALVGSYLLILWGCRRAMVQTPSVSRAPETALPPFDPWQTGKGLAAVAALVALFLTPIPREVSALGVAGVLLCSRRMKTRDMLGLVDWHLITLFGALFVVTHAISQGSYPATAVSVINRLGIELSHPAWLTAVSALLSNIFSNVPAAMLLIRFLDPAEPLQWYVLSVSSTFAGNLFIIGSIANLIVIEQAARLGIRIGFARHAAVGVPVTVFSLAVLVGWAWM
ncbi:MAG: SLC13 family permease [Pseudomonadota bacterium]